MTKEEIEQLRQRLEQSLGVNIRHRFIKAIHLNSAYHWQPPLYIEVDGNCANLAQDSPPEKIIAIFEATTFLVVTPDHGFDKDFPHFFAKEDVRQVIEMD